MKQLTDAERLEVAMDLLDDEQVDAYTEQCAELEREGIPLGMKPLPKVECESLTCRECLIKDMEQRKIDCPYVD